MLSERMMAETIKHKKERAIGYDKNMVDDQVAQWADEVAKLERVARAARVFQEFAYSYKERGLPILFPYADENNELTAALADLGALGG